MCALLHNICKERNISLPEEEDPAGDEAGEGAQPLSAVQIAPAAGQKQQDGLHYRDA